MDSKTINKAYQTLVKRINASSRFFSGSGHDTFDSEGGCTTRFFWNQAQPAFEKTKDGAVKLALVYGSTTCYQSSICDGKQNNSIVYCFASKADAKRIPFKPNSFFMTMRQCKSHFGMSMDDFKRIWLTIAIHANCNLYKLGHAGKPFLKVGETIESLAVEYDVNKA